MSLTKTIWNITLRTSVLYALAGFLTVSCSDDTENITSDSEMMFSTTNNDWASGQTKPKVEYGEVVKLESESGSPLYFRAVSTDRPDVAFSHEASTRGPLIKKVNMYESFQVSAYRYTGTWSNALTPNYIYNETITKDITSGSYKPTGGRRYYWPGSSYNMRFFAHAPNLDATVLSISPKEQQGSIILTYTTPQSINSHKDLLVAVSDEVPGNYNRPVPLRFKHVFTALRVVARNMRPGIVKSISIAGVFPKRRYDMAANDWMQFTREEYKMYAQAVYTLNLNVAITGEKDQPITDENNMMFFIPQPLPRNDVAEMRIVYQPTGGQEQTLVAKLLNKTPNWEKGKVITFYISTSDNISIDTDLGDFGDGGDL